MNRPFPLLALAALLSACAVAPGADQTETINDGPAPELITMTIRPVDNGSFSVQTRVEDAAGRLVTAHALVRPEQTAPMVVQRCRDMVTGSTVTTSASGEVLVTVTPAEICTGLNALVAVARGSDRLMVSASVHYSRLRTIRLVPAGDTRLQFPETEEVNINGSNFSLPAEGGEAIIYRHDDSDRPSSGQVL